MKKFGTREGLEEFLLLQVDVYKKQLELEYNLPNPETHYRSIIVVAIFPEEKITFVVDSLPSDTARITKQRFYKEGYKIGNTVKYIWIKE